MKMMEEIHEDDGRNMKDRSLGKILNKYKIYIILTIMLVAIFSINCLTVYGQDWTEFGGNAEHNCVTDVKLPDNAEDTSLKWAIRMPGNGQMGESCTPPIIVGSKLYSAAKDKLFELDKENGRILRTVELNGSTSFAMNPIAYAKDKFTANEPYVFIQLNDGRIQCININSMQSVWISKIYENEQTVTPVVYRNGKVYTGTYDSNIGGRYLCFDANGKGTQKPKWSLVPSDEKDGKRGFYWAGAYVSEKYAVFGSNTGENTGKSILYSVNPDNGKVIDKIKDIEGDIRSTVVRSGDNVYFATKAGRVYKVGIESSGKFNRSKLKFQSLGQNVKSTASPVISDGRLFIGSVDMKNEYGSDGSHKMNILDAETLKIEKAVSTPGGSKAQALVTKNTGENGKVRIYFTCNTPPGGIFFIEYKQGEDFGKWKKLFTPEKNMQEHCISPLCCDDKGVIYYKNDSNHLMAVERNLAKLSSLSIKDKANGTEGKWTPRFSPENRNYEVIVDKLTNGKVNLTPKAPSGQSIEVDGKVVESSKSVDVSVGDKPVEVKVSTEENTGENKILHERIYKINVMGASANAFLEDLRVSKSNANAFDMDENSSNLIEYTPKFKADNLTYHTKMFDEEQRFINIWPKAQQKGAKVYVKPVENVANSDDKVDEDGNIKPEDSSGSKRYPVYFEKGKKYSKVKIVVISENGKVTNEYSLTIIRSKDIGRKILKLSKRKLSLYKGQKYKLGLEVKGEDPGDVIKWESTNKKVAKVDQKGNITAIKPGKTSIYVSCNNDEEAYCTVKVTPKEFEISKRKVSLNIGEKYKVYITRRNPKGTVKYKFINAKSKKHLKLYSDGTIRGKKIGTGQILFTCNGITRKLTVKVINFKLKKTVIKLKKGKKFKLKILKNQPKGKVKYALKCKSDKKYIAISSKGVIKAKRKKGTAYALAKCNGKNISIKVIIR